MAVSSVVQGGSINATDYNNLQSKVAQILGVGSGDYGYGQTVTSSQVVASNYPTQPAVGDFVTAQQLDDLRTDIEKCYVHQTTSAFLLGDIAVGDWITAGASAGTDSATHNQYVSYVNTIDTNRLPTTSLNTAQMDSVFSVRSSSRTSAWNGTINFIFTVSFTNANHRRYFFNTGGEIRINLAMSGTSGSKSNNWAAMVTNAPDPVTFGYTQNSSLTQNWTNLYTATGSGVYLENDLIVRVKQGTNVYDIQFEVRLQDDDTGDQQLPAVEPGPAVDENVNGTITCSVDEFKAVGSYVSIASPSYATDSAFQ